MQPQRGEGPSLEALHGTDKVQGAAYKHMLYQLSNCYSGETGRPAPTSLSDI